MYSSEGSSCCCTEMGAPNTTVRKARSSSWKGIQLKYLPQKMIMGILSFCMNHCFTAGEMAFTRYSHFSPNTKAGTISAPFCTASLMKPLRTTRVVTVDEGSVSKISSEPP